MPDCFGQTSARVENNTEYNIRMRSPKASLTSIENSTHVYLYPTLGEVICSSFIMYPHDSWNTRLCSFETQSELRHHHRVPRPLKTVAHILS